MTGAEVREFDQRDTREEGVIDFDLPDNLPDKIAFEDRLLSGRQASFKDWKPDYEPPWRYFPRKREEKKQRRIAKGLPASNRGKRSKSGERRYLEKKILYELRKENPHLNLVKVRTVQDLTEARESGQWPAATCRSRSTAFLEPNAESDTVKTYVKKSPFCGQTLVNFLSQAIL